MISDLLVCGEHWRKNNIVKPEVVVIVGSLSGEGGVELRLQTRVAS
jgi:hypothetical protein